MTIAKRILCLCLSLLCVGLLGCQKQTFPFDELLTDSQEKSVSYAMIIPSEQAYEYRTAADRLAEGIQAKTGAQVQIYQDADTLPSEEWIRIAVGPVALSWVTPKLRDMKALDYCCRWLEGGLWLGGRTAVATSLAVDRFLQELLPAATKELLLSQEGGFDVQGRYQAESLLLQETPLSEYRIVYERENEESLLPMAALLRERIKVVSGDLLTVEADNGSAAQERTVLLRQSSPYGGSHTAYIYAEGPSVILCANDSLGVSVALQAFSQLLLAEETGDCWQKSVTETISLFYGSPKLRLGTFSSESMRSFSSFVEVSETVELLRGSMPDLALLGELEADQIHYLTDSLQQYGVLGETAEAPAGIFLRSGVLAEESSEISLQLWGESYGFWLCVIPKEAPVGWEQTVASLTAQGQLPVLVILHGEREAVLDQEAALSSLSLVSAFQWDYQGNGCESRISCLATAGTLSVEQESLSVEHGYACLSVTRLRLP